MDVGAHCVSHKWMDECCGTLNGAWLQFGQKILMCWTEIIFLVGQNIFVYWIKAYLFLGKSYLCLAIEKDIKGNVASGKMQRGSDFKMKREKKECRNIFDLALSFHLR